MYAAAGRKPADCKCYFFYTCSNTTTETQTGRRRTRGESIRPTDPGPGTCIILYYYRDDDDDDDEVLFFYVFFFTRTRSFARTSPSRFPRKIRENLFYDQTGALKYRGHAPTTCCVYPENESKCAGGVQASVLVWVRGEGEGQNRKVKKKKMVTSAKIVEKVRINSVRNAVELEATS